MSIFSIHQQEPLLKSLSTMQFVLDNSGFSYRYLSGVHRHGNTGTNECHGALWSPQCLAHLFLLFIRNVYVQMFYFLAMQKSSDLQCRDVKSGDLCR